MAAQNLPLSAAAQADAPRDIEPALQRHRPSVASADVDEAIGSPAHDLRARLIAEYADVDTQKWPPAVRLLLIVGGAVASWAGIGSAVALALR